MVAVRLEDTIKLARTTREDVNKLCDRELGLMDLHVLGVRDTNFCSYNIVVWIELA